MSTIAIVPSDVTSKRMLADRLAGRLTAAGHRVVTVVDVAAIGGAEPLGEYRLVPLRAHAGGRVSPWRPDLYRRASRRTAAELDPAALEAVLQDIAADLLIVDIEEYEALILAHALPSPPRLAVLCSFFDVWPIAGLGPNDPGPARGPGARVRGELEWWWLWTRMRLYDAKRQLRSGDVDRISISRALARRLGVRRQFTARQWLHPFAPRWTPLLVCNAIELDIPHDARPGVVHIGSLLEPAGPEGRGAIDDPSLEAMVERARSNGRPIVVCVFGTLTTGDRDVLVDRIGGLARSRPGIEFVVGLSADGREAELDELPNVVTRRWIPQRALLAVADAAFVHTGNATLHECVVAGVPMLVRPLGVNDQQRNAARVVRHGIGVIDDGGTVESLAERLDGLLDDNEGRRRLDELRDQVMRYERDSVAVAAVEHLVHADPTRAPVGRVIGALRSRP